MYYQSMLGLSSINASGLEIDNIEADSITTNQFRMPTGAEKGYILTSDDVGEGKWMPDPNVNLLGDAVGPLLTNRIDTLAGGDILVEDIVLLDELQTITNKNINAISLEVLNDTHLNTLTLLGNSIINSSGKYMLFTDNLNNYFSGGGGKIGTSGAHNVAVGNTALQGITTGNFNAAFAAGALYSLTSGYQNTGFGVNAGSNISSGYDNIGIGVNSGVAITTGSGCVCIGNASDVLSGNLTNSMAIGYQAKVDVSNKIQLGNSSISTVSTSGVINSGGLVTPSFTMSTSPGWYKVMTSDDNGLASWTTTGGDVTGSVGASVVSKINGTAVAGASVENTANNLVLRDWNGACAVGNITAAQLLTPESDPILAVTNIGIQNCFLGRSANLTATGSAYNTSTGYRALNKLTSGIYNTAIGATALYNTAGAVGNTAVGFQSLFSNVGGGNTAIGYNSLTTNTTGTSNTGLGNAADVTVGTLTNATAIGFNAKVSTSNSIQLGNTSVTDVKTSGKITAPALCITTGAGTAGQILTSDTSGNASWVSPSPSTSVTMGGDVTGNSATSIVSKINGTAVAGASVANTSNYLVLRDSNGAFATGTITASQLLVTGSDPILAVTNVGTQNCFLGRSSNLSATGSSYNTSAGYRALSKLTTGLYNTAIGTTSLYNTTAALANTAVGVQSLWSNTGDGNTALGVNSLTSNTSGVNNTGLGNGSDVTVGTLTNATAIGFNARVSTSNSIQLGNTSVTDVNTSGKITCPALRMTNGSGTAGQILTSDTLGNATWQNPASATVPYYATTTFSTTFTGPYNITTPVNFKLVRVGDSVTMTMLSSTQSGTSTTSTTFVSVSSIPSTFLPNPTSFVTTFIPISVLNGGFVVGSLGFYANGRIAIYAAGGGNFGSGGVGFYGMSVSWSI
jgi:hypothetical protein